MLHTKECPLLDKSYDELTADDMGTLNALFQQSDADNQNVWSVR